MVIPPIIIYAFSGIDNLSCLYVYRGIITTRIKRFSVFSSKSDEGHKVNFLAGFKKVHNGFFGKIERV